MRAERVGSDTLLAQIVQMVGEAQRSRAPIQRLADAWPAWFVPAVIAIAAVTFYRVVCFGPQPVSPAHRQCRGRLDHRLPLRSRPGDADVDHGRHRPGRAGRRADQKRRSPRDAGKGRYARRRQDRHADRGEAEACCDCRRSQDSTEDEVLRLAASLERASEHPLGAAIVSGAKDGIFTLRVQRFHHRGQRRRGRVDGHNVAVGNSALLSKIWASSRRLNAEAAKQSAPTAQTVIFVSPSTANSPAVSRRR